MQIIGYIGYGVIIFLAITWTLGVRMKLGAGVHTVLGALFFMASAIVLGVFEIPKIHSLWLLPSGFVFVMWICPFIFAYEIPLLGSILKFFGSIYASVVRIGIPREKIRTAQELDAMETVQNWADKDE